MNRVLLICFVDSKIGIGHLSRLLAIAEQLKNENYIVPEFLIFGSLVKKSSLKNFTIHNYLLSDSLSLSLANVLNSNNFSGLIFDLYPKLSTSNLGHLFKQLKKKNYFLISIDSLFDYCHIFDLIWVPSINFDPKKYQKFAKTFKTGWDSLLIEKRISQNIWSPGKELLVLTGGSDFYNLGKILPNRLDLLLDMHINVHWVKGPFSNAPNIPEKKRLNWTLHDAPEYLDDLIVQSNYVLTVFGVSFFEVLQYGIPSVVFSPNDSKDKMDLEVIKEEEVSVVCGDIECTINSINKLMKNTNLAEKYSMNSSQKMSAPGTENFSKELSKLLGVK